MIRMKHALGIIDIMRNPSTNNREGFGLVEIVIVTGVLAASLFAFLQTEVLSVRLLRTERDNLEAALLAQEGLEGVRSIRDESWTDTIAPLVNGTMYYPVVENSKWKLVTSDPGAIEGRYTRTIVFSQVFRNASDQIAPSGTLDAGTRKVTSRVAWGNGQKELVGYVTDFSSSLAHPTETKTIFFEDAPTEGNLAAFPSNNAGDGDSVQTFTTLASALTATKVELFLKRITPIPSNIYVELRVNPTGAILGTSTVITGSTTPDSALGWVVFRFADPVALAAATSYAIRLRSVPASTDAFSGSAGTIYWGYRQTASSPYLGGDAYRYVGRLSNPFDGGQQLTQYDYGFRLFSTP